METRSNWTDLIPGVGLTISEAFDQGDELYTPGIFSILRNKTTDQAQKNYTGKTGFGRLKKFDDGDDIPTASRYKTYTTKVVINNYGEAVEVTANQIDDRDFEAELDEMKDLSRAANESVDMSGAQLLNGAFATTVNVNGYDMTWYGDGVPLCSTVHPSVVPGASTQSNASSTGIALTFDNYETGRLALQLQQTDNGLPMTLAGKTTIITSLNNEKEAKEVVESDLVPNTANNAINVFKGTTDVITSVYFDTVNGGLNSQWFVVNVARHKLNHDTRQEKMLNSDTNIRNKVVTFTVDARWADSATDWRGVWGSKGNLAAYSS
jgi:hypothetical protein